MSKVFRFVTGLIFLALGIAGLALPILPGWAFILTGIAVWAPVFPWARRFEVKVRTFLADHIPGALGELIAVKELDVDDPAPTRVLEKA